MKTILVTAYAMNPYKGSEDGMGWNFVLQIARYHRVIAVTRTNNGPDIRKYMAENKDQEPLFKQIDLWYFDWPPFLRWWKKGPLLAMIYYYGWQLSLGFWLLRKRPAADIVHNLNFHNDWTPSFLWFLRKPLVWGPVGHHSAVPRAFLQPVYGTRAWVKDRILWLIKTVFWKADPFLRLTARRAGAILCMNTQAAQRRRGVLFKCHIIPSVASEEGSGLAGVTGSAPRPFTVLSAGRFVPLKGFDLTIRAFAVYYRQLPASRQEQVQLVLIGNGPGMPLMRRLIEEEGVVHCTRVIEWIPREKMLQMYREADVFLFPSHEGAGMVVAEAMSYGLPVVCLDNEGPGEFLHPESRLRVSRSSYDDTVHGLADRLADLTLHAGYYREEKEKAIQQWRDVFDWNKRGEQLKHIYEDLCLHNAS